MATTRFKTPTPTRWPEAKADLLERLEDRGITPTDDMAEYVLAVTAHAEDLTLHPEYYEYAPGGGDDHGLAAALLYYALVEEDFATAVKDLAEAAVATDNTLMDIGRAAPPVGATILVLASRLEIIRDEAPNS